MSATLFKVGQQVMYYGEPGYIVKAPIYQLPQEGIQFGVTYGVSRKKGSAKPELLLHESQVYEVPK